MDSADEALREIHDVILEKCTKVEIALYRATELKLAIRRGERERERERGEREREGERREREGKKFSIYRLPHLSSALRVRVAWRGRGGLRASVDQGGAHNWRRPLYEDRQERLRVREREIIDLLDY